MNTMTGQKAVLAEVRQREFEAYNQVKKSCHMVEQAQLEKAEVPVSSKEFFFSGWWSIIIFISLSAVQIYDLSYIHLHSSPSTVILRTNNVTSSLLAW